MTTTAPPSPLVRPRLAVYADSTSATCYLPVFVSIGSSSRGNAAPEWRAIKHRPRLPVMEVRLGGRGRAVRCRELRRVRELAKVGEELEARLPGFLSNTRATVAAYAEACEVSVADRTRRLLFDAYRVKGVDIGDPEVLRQLSTGEVKRAQASTDAPPLSGVMVSAQRGPVSTAACLRIRDWQDAWLRLGTSIDLIVVNIVVNPHIIECDTAALRGLGTGRERLLAA